MSSQDEKRKAIIILCSICVVLLAVGIPLAASAETVGSNVVQGQMWKLVLGVMMASFGGFGLIGIAFVVLRHRVTKDILDPYTAYSCHRLSRERYDSIRKKETVALIIMSVLAVAMLIAWFNPFSIILAAGMILGAVGALLASGNGKGSLLRLGIGAGIVVGIISALSTKIDRSKQYEYFVNGVKVGEGNGAAGNFLSSLLGGVLLGFFLIIGIAYLITIICTMVTKE